MMRGIRFARQWIDEDMVELTIEIGDGSAVFSNQIYVGHKQLRDAVEGLHAFKDHVYGGIFNLRFGEFGPEYGSGAFDARLQFRQRGKIWLRVSAQSQFERFDGKDFASEATLYLITETALFDQFVRDFRAMSVGDGEQAKLEAIDWN